MADISMCGNPEKCPKKSTCYRVTAIPNKHWQSYCDFYVDGEECEYYWER